MEPSAAHFLSVVVPVLDEVDGLPETHKRVRAALEATGARFEVVYVDDGSTDGSTELIGHLAQTEPEVRMVQLSRNYGMDIAMSAGLDHARGDYVVLIHADMQDPPELIPRMLELARTEHADVVFTRRIGRDESGLKRGLATLFYKLMERLARVPYQGQAGDFRLMSRRVVDAVRMMPERRRFLRGIIAWVGFKQVPIEYERAARSHGTGASYPQLLRLAAEALTAFSDVPLSIATFAGTATAVVSFMVAASLLILAAFHVVHATVSLYILLALVFLAGLQLISVGIIGRYLARVHEEALGRPLYLLERVVEGAVSESQTGETRAPSA